MSPRANARGEMRWMGHLEGKDGLVRGELPEVEPDEGVAGRPPPPHLRGSRRHWPEGAPGGRYPPVTVEVGGGGRRRAADAGSDGAVH